MLRTESNAEMIDALEQVEVSLQSPVVPGEMVGWAQAVRNAFQELHSPLNEQFNRVHHQTIRQIEIEDPELSARAMNLRNTDEKNMQQFEKLLQRVSNLPERVNRAEPDEASMESELREIIDDGLQFVLAIRGQETAIDTWMNESVTRDRGSVD